MKQALCIILVVLIGAVVSAAKNPYRLERILEMEDVSSESAIAPLEEILRSDGSKTNIRRYAAAQALFLMDAEESATILQQYLTYSNYDFEYSIRLAFHWGMEPDKRNEFIRKYHLDSHSKEVSVNVKASPQNDAEASFRFTVSITNLTDEPLRLYKPRVYLGKRILLVSKNGEVMKPVLTTEYKLGRQPPEESFPEFASGESLKLTFTAQVKTYPGSPNSEFRNHVWLDCGDFNHKLTQAGIFKVYACYEHRGSEEPAFDNIWTGRAVSDPIEIELKESDMPKTQNPGVGK